MTKRMKYFYDKIASGEINEKGVSRLKHEYKVHNNLEDYLELSSAMDYYKFLKYHEKRKTTD